MEFLNYQHILISTGCYKRPNGAESGLYHVVRQTYCFNTLYNDIFSSGSFLEYICDVTVDEEQIDKGINIVQAFEDAHIDIVKFRLTNLRT